MRAWLTLALLCLVPGCADDHGFSLLSDSGAAPDAVMCTAPRENGGIEALSCPASISAGGRAVVSLTTRSTSCCPDGAALAPVVTRTMGGDEVSITAPYDTCQCCTTCRCIGNAITRDVVVAEVAGSPIHVVAGTHECTIAIQSPTMCHAIEATRGEAPTATPAMRPITAHLVNDGSASTGCGCRPRGVSDATGAISLEACDCCEACPCVDIGYEATVVQVIETAPGVPITLSVSPLVTTTIVDPTTCRDGTAVVTGLTTLGPVENVAEAAPIHGWVRIEAHDMRCCGEPLELVTSTSAPDGSIDLTLAECHPDLCDCAPSNRRDASTAVDLGVLSSGTHVVRAGTFTTTVTIP